MHAQRSRSLFFHQLGLWLGMFALSLAACAQEPSSERLDTPGSGATDFTGASMIGGTEVLRASRYLTMRDGVRIAVDVYLPTDLRQGERVPTMLHQTRYWRSLAYRWPVSSFNPPAPRKHVAKLAERFLAQGYAWVSVDARGSGASYGRRLQSHSPQEVRDGAEIVDWIIEQPWSNGRVGALGMSYDGTSAEFLLVNKHPAVKAVAPMFSLFDAYREIAFPGGIHLAWFTKTWSYVNSNLDRNDLPFAGWFVKFIVKGVRTVDDDRDGSLLSTALRDHAENWNPHREALGITYRDDPPPSKILTNIDELSPHTHLEDIAASGAAVYSYSGWFDGAYQHAAIRRHLSLDDSEHRLILGPWDHGGRRNISPYGAGPVRFDHGAELLRFFDHHLKGKANGLSKQKPIRYYTMGAERWREVDQWPPEATPISYYFGADNALVLDPPTVARGADAYQVDTSTGTGEQSRWHTLIGRPITNPYPDRASQDERLLCYASAPVERDTEVTGHPMATLYVSSTAKDGAVFVYLEDMDESGRVTYITEGILRALHRKLGGNPQPYRDVVPYRTFKRRDGQPLEPGSVAELVFELLPTSYLFKKGHRIRVCLAGADKDHFPLLSGDDTVLTYYRNSQFPSRVELPIVKGLTRLRRGFGAQGAED